jgi:hypothetical protein
MTLEPVARKPLTAAAPVDERRFAAIGWAVTHAPTREAFRRCTGVDAGPVLDRFNAWLAENVIGNGEGVDC